MSQNQAPPKRWQLFFAGHLDRILSGLALGAAVVALLLSWNANRIAFQQLPSRIAVLGFTYLRGSTTGSNQPVEAFCSFTVQVANLGEPSDNIIGYETLVDYKGNRVQFETTNAEVPYAETLENLVPGISHFQSALSYYEVPAPYPTQFDDDYFDDDNSDYWGKFPISLDSRTLIDLPFSLWFKYDDQVIRLRSPKDPDIRSGRNYFDYPQDFSPIEVTIKFRLASGQSVTSPQGQCWYAQVNDPMWTDD